jgi:prolipoprotein diacylglyceryltransferase
MNTKSVCVKLHYNWRQCGEANDMWGEDYDVYEVGKGSVTNIILEDMPEGFIGGDIYSVIFEDGSYQTIYNPNQVFYKEVDNDT